MLCKNDTRSPCETPSIQGARLLIRADASVQIGSGHVMRCLSLAQEWSDLGGKVVFVSSHLPEHLVERLRQERVDYVSLNCTTGSEADSSETINIARQFDAQWIVVDGYHFSAQYQISIKQAGIKLLVLDDFGHANLYHADFILNQNITAEPSIYTRRIASSIPLLGSGFTLLRREFWPWRNQARAHSGRVRHILVTMGGSDPNNIAEHILGALIDARFANSEIRLVVGGSYPHLGSLQTVASRLSAPVQIVCNVSNMAPLMEWADLAITAAGSTCWELAFMGIPMIVVPLDQQQHPFANAMVKAGIARCVTIAEIASQGSIARIVMDLADHPEQIKSMSEQGTRLIDGYGSRRVVCRLLAIRSE